MIVLLKHERIQALTYRLHLVVSVVFKIGLGGIENGKIPPPILGVIDAYR